MNITIYLPEEYREIKQRFPYENWSEVCRTAIIEYIKWRENNKGPTVGCVWF